MRFSTRRRILLASIPALFAAPALAQSDGAWPHKPVRLVVPFSAGSTTDISARLLANMLSIRLKQQFVVDNKPGASGTIGLDLVAKSAPDGYTLVLSGPGPATFHVLFNKLPFDPVKDLVPVSLVYENIGGIVINGAVPANNLTEFAAYARANPGKVNYGSLGKNTTMLMGEQLKQMGNFPMTEVAYPGTPPAVLALLRGDVHMSFLAIEPNLADIKAGKLKLIALSGRKRSPTYPDVPSAAETYPTFQAGNWGGILAPAGTPKAIVDKLSSEIAAVAATQEFKDGMHRVSNAAVGSTPEEFRREIESNMKSWSEVARGAGVKPD